MDLKRLGDKNILILGLGKEGASTLKFLRKKYPQKIIGIADKKRQNQLEGSIQKFIKRDRKLKLHLGRDYQKLIKLYDVVFKSPGVQLTDSKSNKITSQTKMFFNLFKDKIIGVTGTKGKSTTASLIYKILADAKLKVKLVGNIGKPPFDYIDNSPKDTIFVYELSSYQLQDLGESPHVAVFLNLFEEHLDYHGDYQSYKKAKANIAKWQKKEDLLIYNADSDEVLKIIQGSNATKIPFSTKMQLKTGAYLDKERIFYEGEKILKSNDAKLIGNFNLNNILAAVAAAKLLNVPSASISSSIKSFKPLKHRLEYVGNYRGAKFYNDSIATVPEATIAALDALAPNVGTLIVGGYDRGLDFSKLSKKIIEDDVDNLILFPQTGEAVLDLIRKENTRHLPKTFTVKNMVDAVKIASKVTREGKVCLLSPAASSFNLFKNYEDRGQQFINEVNKLSY